MTIARPQSFLWLVAHDLRLSWRGLLGLVEGWSAARMALALFAVVVGLHLLAMPAIGWLRPIYDETPKAAVPLPAVVGGILTWMIAQSLFGATRSLFDRADLDLLLGAPVPARRIIAAKSVSLMASTLASVLFLIAPMADMGAVLDRAAWLSIYPVLLSLALMATAAGLAAAMALFLAFGPRRARTLAHMTGATLAGAFMLGAQIYAALGAAERASVAAWIGQTPLPSALSDVVTRLPVRALHGGLTEIALLLAAGIVAFAAAAVALGEPFARAALAAAGAPSEGSSLRADRAVRSFQPGAAANLRRKEWRLMARDPSFFAQLGLQIIYTVPVAVVLIRSNMVPVAVALVPTLVVIAAQVAGSISWITVSGEDAPELIATAPVAPRAVDRAKLSAVALPVLVILALPLIGILLASPGLAVLTLVFASGGAASTALLNFWHPMPGNRRGMLRRHSQSKLVGLVEHGLAMLWAVAVVLAMVGSLAAVVPIGLAVGTLWMMIRARGDARKKSSTDASVAYAGTAA